MMKKLLTLFLLSCSFSLLAQVYTEPAFPTVEDQVTLYYDATQGSAGLKDCNCDIYIHTGVITNQSTSNSDWKHVKMSWGVANPDWQLSPVPGKPNLFAYTFTPTIKAYYNIDVATETVQKLAFVFRNANGSKEGKGANGGDMYYNIYGVNAGLETLIQYPVGANQTNKIGDSFDFKAVSSKTATLTLTDNGNVIATATGKTLLKTVNVTTGGNHVLKFTADENGVVSEKTFNYFVPAGSVIENQPFGTKLGATYLANGDVRLLLQAPNKSSVYVLGSFNNYTQSTAYQMKRSVDGQYYWVDITGLTAGKLYTYQYLVDGVQRVADPLSEMVLDGNNDKFIPAETYPNMPAFPTETSGIVSVLQPGKAAYNWTATNYVRPANKNLIIYELLVRDFSTKRNFQNVIDSLDYLQRLGINTIELMPIQEFENNNSWGYNPSFHNALDKTYGSQTKFKELVDKAHTRGMAVVVDVVFNHAFSQSPHFQLYNQGGKPTGDSPFMNADATHPFNVGYDYNHESSATKEYVKRCLEFWLTEYKIDGYRFDLSKGFTQVKNPNDVGKWSAYDASRIAILKNYYDFMQSVSPKTLVILEHLSDNNEEKELADYGMMLWGNMNYNYSEASMAYGNNNLSSTFYKNRAFTKPNLVGYQESHDEERLMYRNNKFGNAGNNAYNVKDVKVGNARLELTAAFFYPIPGPKMIWQFGELGYDYSINTCPNGVTESPNCRTDAKPVRWDYYQDIGKRRVFNVTASLINLRKQFPDMELTVQKLTGYFKYMKLEGNGMKMFIVGNFENQNRTALDEGDTFDQWTETGTYYEYFTGQTLVKSTADANGFDLKAGEYRIYTDKKLAAPIGGYIKYILLGANDNNIATYEMEVAPNPTSGTTQLKFQNETATEARYDIMDLSGKLIATQSIETVSGANVIDIDLPTANGIYLVRLNLNGVVMTTKVMKM